MKEHRTVYESIKPIWKYWAQKNENVYRYKYKPEKFERFLPPIDLGWRAEPVVGSLSNVEHRPGGGHKRIFSEKLQWRADAKVCSLGSKNNRDIVGQNSSSVEWCESAGDHSLLGNTDGNSVRRKLYDHVEPKVGSLDNVGHVPGGGNLQIHNQFPRWNKESKVGSLDNIHYNPRSDRSVEIANERLKWHVKPKVSSLGYTHPLPRTVNRNSYDFKQTQGTLPAINHLGKSYRDPMSGNLSTPSGNLTWAGKST